MKTSTPREMRRAIVRDIVEDIRTQRARLERLAAFPETPWKRKQGARLRGNLSVLREELEIWLPLRNQRGA